MPKLGYRQSREHVSKRIQKGESHYRWAGKDISEKGGRSRARRKFLEIGPCDNCGNQDSERHHIDGDTSNNKSSNIRSLCRKCHMIIDGRLEAFKKQAKENVIVRVEAAAKEKRSRTHCKRGHLLSGSNVYLAGNHRQCKECWKINKLARELKGNIL